MSKHNQTPVAASGSAAVLSILQKLGLEAPLTLGNAETGESYPLPPEVAAAIRTALIRLAATRDEPETPQPTELTPNEAAAFLKVSRTYVMKLVQEGALPCRKVGNHNRIPYADAAAYKEQQRARSRAAMKEIYALEREFGPFEGPPPDKSAYRSKGGRDE